MRRIKTSAIIALFFLLLFSIPTSANAKVTSLENVEAHFHMETYNQVSGRALGIRCSLCHYVVTSNKALAKECKRNTCFSGLFRYTCPNCKTTFDACAYGHIN